MLFIVIILVFPLVITTAQAGAQSLGDGALQDNNGGWDHAHPGHMSGRSDSIDPSGLSCIEAELQRKHMSFDESPLVDYIRCL